ncbi:uncharacterized protein LOC122245566 [Penaeus japonicus]|uniref:uncharacterized protein LOC122245566 n=1 Tax=Penaeus japonicus TaxID=27405 RepID=UPI001C713334|nr:uncharacterized protein LOC122245566 [Penaeus japonicus]
MLTTMKVACNTITIVSLCCVVLLFVFVREGSIQQKCYIPDLTSTDQYKQYLFNLQAKCDNWAQLGGWLGAPDDGKKLMCLDERFRVQAGRCVVLSFGVNNEWSFEDDAERLGCKVFAFDPTMGQEDHQRSASISFFRLGISDVEGEKPVGMNRNPVDFDFRQPFPVDRYENIVRRLGLADRVIDYVKMDVELSELDVLRDLLDTSPRLLRNINQLAIEVHHDLRHGNFGPTSTVRKFWPLFHRLRCLGFSIISSRDQFLWQEVVWARDAAALP